MQLQEVEKQKEYGHIVEASFVQKPREKLQADDGINDYDKEYEKGNV